MKSCHLSSAYRAPDTTPNTFPASLLWCLDNVVKRAALPSSQSGKLRGTGVKSLFQSLGQSKWLSWDVNQSFSASKSLSVWNKRLTSAERARRTPCGKISPHGKTAPNGRGQDWWGRGREMSRRDVPLIHTLRGEKGKTPTKATSTVSLSIYKKVKNDDNLNRPPQETG